MPETFLQAALLLYKFVLPDSSINNKTKPNESAKITFFMTFNFSYIECTKIKHVLMLKIELCVFTTNVN